MTKKPDWAMIEAEKVGLKLHWDHKADVIKIAAALRKAKAEGMREAASMVSPDSDDSPQFENFLRSRADAIEKGE